MPAPTSPAPGLRGRWRRVARRPLRAALAALVLVVVAALFATLALVAVRAIWGSPDCTVTVSGGTTELDHAEAVRVSTVVATARRQHRTRALTVARVARQLSDHPDADARADARRVVAALTGRAPAALSCRVPRPPAATGRGAHRLGPAGLVPRAAAVRADIVRRFGDLPLGGFAPGGVRSGHMKGSAHYEGRAIDVFFRPITPAHQRQGWALAQYLVANARRLRLETVIFDARVWTAPRSDEGWRNYRVDTSGDSRRTARILEHRDHVHVDVAR